MGYVIHKDVRVEKDPKDHPILDKKCFSEKHGSLRNELIARRTHDDRVYDSNNEMVYNFLREAFKGTKYLSILKDFEKTSDGRGVWMQFIKNHGDESRWDQSYAKLESVLARKWKSLGDMTLVDHVGTLQKIFERMNLACEHTCHTPLTDREKVMRLLDSIENSDQMLTTAHIANINGDLSGKGSNFQDTVSHLLLADPVEKRLTKSGTKRKYDAVVSGTQLAGRCNETGVDLCWYPTAEFRELSTMKKNALREWCKTPEGQAVFKAAKAKRKAEHEKRSGGSGGGDGPSRKKKKTPEYWNAVKQAAVSMLTKAAKELVKDQANKSTVTRETATQVASMLQVKAAESAAPSISVVPEVKAVNFNDNPSANREAQFSSFIAKLKTNVNGKGKKKKSGN